MSDQSEAKFNIAPFQRVEIMLGPNINRAQGEFFAQLEGQGFYIERCDYPVSIGVVSQYANDSNKIVARDGIECVMPFKGLTIQHPILGTVGYQLFSMTLIIFKSCARYSNQLDSPVVRAPGAYRVETNTALNQTLALAVVPGVRRVKRVNLQTPAITVTSAAMVMLDVNGNSMFGWNYTQTFFGNTYNYLGCNCAQYIQPPGIVAGLANMEFPAMDIPTYAAEIRIIIVGTGLATGTGPYAIFE